MSLQARLAYRTLKGFAKNSALGFRPIQGRYQRRKLRQGYDDAKDTLAYVRRVYETQSAVVGPVDGKDVIEIGPGGNVGTALSFLADGARSACCIDAVPWAQNVELERLYSDIHPGGSKLVRYLAPLDVVATGLPDACADIIYSNACFEHFPQPDAAIREIGRLLKPGGITSHQIDLRDHRDFNRPLDFLCYGDKVWKLMTSNLGDQMTNRWRLSDYLASFTKAGLVIQRVDVNETIEIDGNTKASFAPRFKAKDRSDLQALGVLMVASKPNS